MRQIRETLGLTQQALADRLLLSRNYITLIEAGAKTPSIRVLSAAEALLASANRVSVAQDHLKAGGRGHAAVEESRASYGQVASRIPQQRTPANRSDCEAYAQQLFDSAEISADPNAWPVILHRLKKQFPLDEWEPGEPEKETS